MGSRTFPFQHNRLVNYVARKESDLIEAAQRSVWKEVYERGKHIAAEFDIEPSMPRTTGRQQHRVNVPATNSESHWQRAASIKQQRPR